MRNLIAICLLVSIIGCGSRGSNDAQLQVGQPESNNAKGDGQKSLRPAPSSPLLEPKQSGDTIYIIAEGIGQNHEQATKDALRQAVRQAIGAMVEAESLVADDKLIEDKVVTYSDGLVKTYQETNSRRDGTLTRVTLKVVVERGKVASRLKAAIATTRDVDGKKLFEEVTGKLTAQKKAQRVVELSLRNLSREAVDVRLEGNPEVVSKAAAQITLRVNLAVTIDSATYEKAIADLRRSLESIAHSNGQLSLSASDVTHNKRVRTLSEQLYNHPALAQRKHTPDVRPESDSTFLALYTGAAADKTRSNWSYCILDKSVQNILTSIWLEKQYVHMAFIDQANTPVNARCIDMSGTTRAGEFVRTSLLQRSGNVSFVAPFGDREVGPMSGGAWSVVLTRASTDVSISTNQLATVRSMRYYLSTNNRLALQSGSPATVGKDPVDNSGEMGTLIVAEGVGANKQQALESAFRNAVRQVVGAALDSETVIKNDELIRERLLTYSNGFVRKYEEVACVENGDITRVRIKATVLKRSVDDGLRMVIGSDAGGGVYRLDGKSLIGAVATTGEASGNAAEMVRTAFAGGGTQIWKADLVGKPELVEPGDKSSLVLLRVRFQADVQAYRTFHDRVVSTLGRIARKKGEWEIPVEGGHLAPSHYIQMGGVKTLVQKVVDRNAQQQLAAMPPLGEFLSLPKTEHVIFVGVQSPDTAERWNYFVIDDSAKPILQRVATAVPRIRLTMVDDKDKVLMEETFAAVGISDYVSRKRSSQQGEVNLRHYKVGAVRPCAGFQKVAWDGKFGSPDYCTFRYDLAFAQPNDDTRFLISPHFFETVTTQDGKPSPFDNSTGVARVKETGTVRFYKLSADTLRAIARVRCEVIP